MGSSWTMSARMRRKSPVVSSFTVFKIRHVFIFSLKMKRFLPISPKYSLPFSLKIERQLSVAEIAWVLYRGTYQMKNPMTASTIIKTALVINIFTSVFGFSARGICLYYIMIKRKPRREPGFSFRILYCTWPRTARIRHINSHRGTSKGISHSIGDRSRVRRAPTSIVIVLRSAP